MPSDDGQVYMPNADSLDTELEQRIERKVITSEEIKRFIRQQVHLALTEELARIRTRLGATR